MDMDVDVCEYRAEPQDNPTGNCSDDPEAGDDQLPHFFFPFPGLLANTFFAPSGWIAKMASTVSSIVSGVEAYWNAVPDAGVPQQLGLTLLLPPHGCVSTESSHVAS